METFPEKAKYLIQGFRRGFSLEYTGPKIVKRQAPNLKLTCGDETDLWNKVMKEVKLKRFAGPFRQVSFSNYIQSPIGLVPKDSGRDTRLIFHLSYPRNGLKESVNSNIDPDKCKVVYPEFSRAITRCLQEGRFCYLSRSDFSSAFRNLSILRKHWKYLVMRARNPDDGKLYFSWTSASHLVARFPAKYSRILAIQSSL